MRMPYKQGWRLPGHHYEGRHDAPAYNRKCISELVGPNWFPYGTPDIVQAFPISIAIGQVVVGSVTVPSISVVEPYGIHEV